MYDGDVVIQYERRIEVRCGCGNNNFEHFYHIEEDNVNAINGANFSNGGRYNGNTIDDRVGAHGL